MPDSTSGSNEYLRIGGQDSILMYNRERDDATLPDLSPDGVASSTALPTGSFQCFEYLVASNGTLRTWLNGSPIAGLQVGPGISNAYSNGWGSSYKPQITGVYFGWESYSGDSNTFWYDDVAISSSVSDVKCVPSGGGWRGLCSLYLLAAKQRLLDEIGASIALI
jgi:hypothetical protein